MNKVKTPNNGLLEYRVKQIGPLYYVQTLVEEKVFTLPWKQPKYFLVWRYVGKDGYPTSLKKRLLEDHSPPLPGFNDLEEAKQKILEFWEQQRTEEIYVNRPQI